jgi:phospholipase C
VSPLIPKGTIDHRVYDHSSVPATLEKQFKLKAMTKRDANALSVMPLLSLEIPRTDAPTILPNPANSGLATASASTAANLALSASKGSLPLFLHAALKADVENTPEAKDAIHAEFKKINTRADAEAYMQKVKAKIGK